MKRMNIKQCSKMMRVLAIGAIAAAACGCSQKEDAAAPPPATAAPAVTTSAPAAAPTANVQLTPELAARLVRARSPVLGKAEAPVTIVEFLDPACPACRGFAPVVKQILFVHPDEVRVVVRLAAFHPGSEEAIRLLEAARRQGKFDETLTALFDRQEEWANHSAPNPAQAWQIAAEAGVNVEKARRDAHSASVDAMIREESKDLTDIKVDQTPTFYVNGKLPSDFGPGPLMELVTSEIKAAQH